MAAIRLKLLPAVLDCLFGDVGVVAVSTVFRRCQVTDGEHNLSQTRMMRNSFLLLTTDAVSIDDGDDLNAFAIGQRRSMR